MVVNFFVWWIKFYLDLAYRIFYALFGVELEILKYASEKICKIAICSALGVFVFILLFLCFASGFFMFGSVAKSFVLPNNEFRYVPNIYEKGKLMKGNLA